jgi:FtsP/CotA-like multicopper oxidase with cupredoxin domain
MRSRHILIIISLIVAIASLIGGVNMAYAGPGGGTYYANSPASGVTGTALRKFVDSLPGICINTGSGTNNLGQCIPLAQPDTSAYAGSDYYEIGLRQYAEKLHSDLPKATKLRGYYQINTVASFASYTNHYLGPLIVATTNRPVRLKFVNNLPTGTAGNLFIPVDTSLMGAGTSPLSAPGTNCNVSPKPSTCYTESRASVHLHGGNTPWISDGTPYQWINPVGEVSTDPSLTRGTSQVNVPDMPDPGDGAETLFWSNQQSGRFMFYHDHAVGITRLNVYAGMAAGYLLVNPPDETALQAAGVPGTIITNPSTGAIISADLAHLVPLVIQDKTFVPKNIATQDSKWNTTKWGTYGDLWFPHVYEANQDPNSPDGANPFGRWDYGPWFWPPVNVDPAYSELPEPTTTPEAFMDTPIVNGTAYPYLVVQPTKYRFQILNACNDRVINLQLYYANPGDPTGKEVKMVAAASNPSYPADWPTDGRDGGVPDPATVGPNMIQIGSEGGLLPNPVVIPNRPIGYDYNRRNIVVLNTLYRALMLGPAERADVIIDFSSVPPGSKLILYNDAPAPNPAFDVRYDFYTGDPDNTFQGGAPSTLVGYGPNTRTIMQFQVVGTPTAPFNVAALSTVLPARFAASQPTPVVPESQFNTAYGQTFSDHFSKISDYSMTYTPINETIPVIMPFRSKAIQELWDMYGRMNATLGVELPFTTNLNQTTIPMGYAEPTTEIFAENQPQIWKITHNGVDTHPVHFHLFNVQLLNRVGWDGAIRPPDDNEYGWKETIRMNPLEDAIVAIKPIDQYGLPFQLPYSTRPLEPSQSAAYQVPTTNLTTTPPTAITVPNDPTDFGFEYVWHCHILGHEENDFMRPMIFRVPTAPPAAPSNLAVETGGPTTGYGRNENVLTWTDNADNLAMFEVQRELHIGGTWTTLAYMQSLPTYTPTYVDSAVDSAIEYDYRVRAFNYIVPNAPNALTSSARGNSTYDAASIITNAFSLVSSVTFTPNKPTPHPVGTNVLFTALATGPSTSMVYKYRFSLNNVVQQNYSTNPSWALDAATPVGVYTIQVDAQASPSDPGKSASMTYSVIVQPPPVVTVDPTTLPGIYTGPTVTVLMSTNVPANIYYTTDGTVPNTLSPIYVNGITVTATTNLNYFAVDQNGTPSVVGFGTWTIHSPDMVASMLINNGVITTNTTTVTLTLSAVDPAPCPSFPTGVQSMQFSNDNITYSAEEPYSTSKVWALTPGLDGPRYVYAKFRDCSLPLPGGTLYSAITASIGLDTVPPLTTASPSPGMYAGPTVTITLATSKLGSIYYTTDGTTPTPASTKYIAPIVMSSTTTLNFYAVDIAGNAESPVKTGTWTIHSPDMVSSININNGAATTNNVNVTLTLAAVDPAGVATMQFSNDGVTYTAEEAYATTKAWILVPGDGVKMVYVRFRDASLGGGALYPPISATIVLVTGAPITTASPIPGIYGASPVTVALTPSNPLSTIYYTTDGTIPTTLSNVYTSPISLLKTTTLNYFAVDIAGNVEAIKTGTWTISIADLSATININNAATATKSPDVTLTLNATDPAGVATMQFSNDGVTYTPEEAYAATKAWTLTPGDGLKTVYVKFRDSALPSPGILYAPVAANIMLDTIPAVTTAAPVTGLYSAAPVIVTLTANEPATIYYTTDGTTPTTASATYTGPISLSAALTTINYFAVDIAGNVEAPFKSGTWMINTTGIVSSIKINNGAASTNNAAVTLSLYASDIAGIATMQFSNDGVNYTAEEPYTTSKAWTLASGDGVKSVYVRFRDYSLPTGTLFAPITAGITLDSTPPITSSGPIPGTYTSLPLSVTLTANEPATIYYTTDGTTPTTASTVYTSPIPISMDVVTTIKYFGVDTTGNVEAIKTGTWNAILPDGNLGYGGTVNDAYKALMIASGIITPTADDLLHGDVAPFISGKPRPDGTIDIGDVVVLLRKAVGLVTW